MGLVSLLPPAAIAPQTRDMPGPATDRVLAMRRTYRPYRLHRACGIEACDLSHFLSYLEDSTGRRLSFFGTGESETSFDEDWLSGIFDAIDRNDAASYRFLLLQRLTKAQASEAHFLACRARAFLE